MKGVGSVKIYGKEGIGRRLTGDAGCALIKYHMSILIV
jgi:hypothetical protein